MTKNLTTHPLQANTPAIKRRRVNDLSSDVIPINLKQVENTYRIPTKTDTTANINKFWETMKLEDKNSQLSYLMKNHHPNEAVSDSEDTKEFSFSNSVLENSALESDIKPNISLNKVSANVNPRGVQKVDGRGDERGDVSGSIEAEKVAIFGDFEFEMCKENEFTTEAVQEPSFLNDCETEAFNNTEETNEVSNKFEYFSPVNTEIVHKKISAIKTKQSELKPIILHKSLESAILILKPGARFHDNITLQSFQGFVIKGKVNIKINKREYKATRDDMFLIERKTVYDIHSESDTKLLLVFNPKE